MLWKMWAENLFRALFDFQRIFGKKEFEEVCVLMRTNIDSVANTYLLNVACFKKFIFH